jgi:hypothetical protein
VRDEGGAEGSEDDPGRPVVHTLAAHPHPPPGEVDGEEPITVCQWTPHVHDSALALIGIRRQKFTRKLVLTGLIAALFAASGCGGDDETASTAPTTDTRTETAETSTEARTETEPVETETQAETATEPEAMPGGAGDEEPARTLALFTGRGGRIAPRVVRVPAFIQVKVELRSGDGATYALRFGDTTITAGGALKSVSTTIDGLRPGEAIAGKANGRGTDVRISATAEPGP